MINETLNKSNTIKSNTFMASIVVASLVLFGKVFGFLRDAVVAAYYGANWQTDAFFFAQSMPGMVFPAVCNSISTAFISIYVSRTVNEGEASADKFASRSLIFTTGLAGLLSVIAIIFMPLIVKVLAPGFISQQLELAVHLARLTMSAFVFTMVQYILTSILNSRKFYYGSQIAGIAYNILIIVITVSLGKTQGMDSLTLTVVFAHITQVLILVILSAKHFRFSIMSNPFHADLITLIKLATPILLGNSVVQLNTIVDKALASLLSNGSLSALTYSSSINNLVTGVIIVALTTVLYPSMTSNVASGDMRKFESELIKGLTLLSMVLIPISIAFTLFSTEIVTVIFSRGSFTQEAVRNTSDVLMFYAGMYVFTAFREVIVRAFYALKDTKTPMINTVIAVGLNAVFSWILVKYMGIGGIALGTTLSTAILAVSLLIKLKQKVPHINLRRLKKAFGKFSISAVIAVAVGVFFSQLTKQIAPFYKLLIGVFAIFLAYFVALVLLKSKDMTDMIYVAKQLLGKAVSKIVHRKKD